MNAHLRILHVIWIGEEGGPLAFRIILLQFLHVGVCHIRLFHSRIEQVEMIVGILQMLIVRIMIHQSAEGFFAEREVIQLILEDDARMIESVFQELVAFCQLLWRERNLGEVVLPLVRIVHGTVGNLLERIFLGSHIGERISHLVGHLLGALCRCNHRLVDTLPVIHILSLAP